MPTIPHLLLALALTLFLAVQAGALVRILRARRALASGRKARRSEILWTTIPVAIVLFLAVRSWLAVIDLERPAAASSAVSEAPTPSEASRPPR